MVAFAVLVPPRWWARQRRWRTPTSVEAAGSGLLLVFAWATAARATWGWLARRPTVAGCLAALAALTVAVFAYVALLDAVTRFLAPSVAGAGDATASPWLLLVVLGALVLATSVRLALGRFAQLHKTLYVLALSAGHVRDRGGYVPVGAGAPDAGWASVPSSLGRRGRRP